MRRIVKELRERMRVMRGRPLHVTLWQWARHNWPWRVSALAAAVALWAYVQIVTNVGTVPLTVPIGAIRVRENHQAEVFTTNGEPLQAISVNVMCSARDRDRLRDVDYTVEIDLQDEAENIIPSFQLRANEHIKYRGRKEFADRYRIVSFSPDRVRLVIDSTEMRLVTVEPVYTGTPAEGYEVSSISANPTAVMIKGPARIIREMTTIPTETIDITGLSKPFQKPVRVGATNTSVTVVDKTPVEVNIGINTKPVQRRFGAVPVLALGQPAQGRQVRFNPKTVTVILQGVRELMDMVEPRTVRAFVDVRELTTSGFSLPVQALAPANVQVVSVMPNVVTVSLTEE
ncbi:MAG: CdaR family protein [bacterium]|nr:CdaR family protein [bacterium]